MINLKQWRSSGEGSDTIIRFGYECLIESTTPTHTSCGYRNEAFRSATADPPDVLFGGSELLLEIYSIHDLRDQQNLHRWIYLPELHQKGDGWDICFHWSLQIKIYRNCWDSNCIQKCLCLRPAVASSFKPLHFQQTPFGDGWVAFSRKHEPHLGWKPRSRLATVKAKRTVCLWTNVFGRMKLTLGRETLLSDLVYAVNYSTPKGPKGLSKRQLCRKVVQRRVCHKLRDARSTAHKSWTLENSEQIVSTQLLCPSRHVNQLSDKISLSIKINRTQSQIQSPVMHLLKQRSCLLAISKLFGSQLPPARWKSVWTQIPVGYRANCIIVGIIPSIPASDFKLQICRMLSEWMKCDAKFYRMCW